MASQATEWFDSFELPDIPWPPNASVCQRHWYPATQGFNGVGATAELMDLFTNKYAQNRASLDELNATLAAHLPVCCDLGGDEVMYRIWSHWAPEEEDDDDEDSNAE
jgi:hypothetical protein